MKHNIACPRVHAVQTLALLVMTWYCGIQTVAGQTTAFTYQGRLTDVPSDATGLYDLSFSLFATSSGGAPVSGPLTTNGVAVSNGLFTVTLAFGTSAFPSADRWLKINVQTNGGGAFTTLALGLIAQEVEPLFPEAVGEHNGTKALAYSTLVPVTIGAIQELNLKLEQKEAEITELQQRLEKLERLVSGKRGGSK